MTVKQTLCPLKCLPLFPHPPCEEGIAITGMRRSQKGTFLYSWGSLIHVIPRSSPAVSRKLPCVSFPPIFSMLPSDCSMYDSDPTKTYMKLKALCYLSTVQLPKLKVLNAAWEISPLSSPSSLPSKPAMTSIYSSYGHWVFTQSSLSF